ncbi:type II secretion system F family protein [Paenibacillus lemnae]|uniref:Type II secretion protein F n=1 Tax=Paenibacillus lemnae TaxID=1330551 RepID=A0A848M8F9_PAELE|nr:type II secretion system F family protein [Paenibacillus lemnae]NMO95794.1 type II secretion protein F [Paenibacillus lemnae]
MLRGVCGVVVILLVGGWVVLNYRSAGRYRAWRRIQMEGVRLQRWASPLLLILERSRLLHQFPVLYFRIERSVQKIYGMRLIQEMTLLFIAEALLYGWLTLAAGCTLTLMTGQTIGILGGLALAVVLPFSFIKDLERKVMVREQEMVMELPELLNKMVLLVGAGETVQKALVHCCHRKKEDSHPLYGELKNMIAEWEGGHSFQQAFEQFSKRCSVQEVSIFTTTVLLNFRRGGNDFVLALRDLSRVLWEKRKAIARTRGEQASSKLVFPMVVIFMVVLVLIGTPALMMINM